MKKHYCKPIKFLISVLVLVICFSSNIAITCSAKTAKVALPLSAGIEALRGQFQLDVSEKYNQYELDYAYYSPVGKNDNDKYPVVIYLHGIGHGSYFGSQLDDSDMAYWASRELQSKWKDTDGAYILLPRCPEDEAQYWNKSFVEPLHTLIDSFISKHEKNIDKTRIFIGGSSAGGEMTWDMAIAYPEYFAGIFPLAATGTRTSDDIAQVKDVAIWLFSSKLDPLVNYYTNVLPTWNNISKLNSNPENCRLSSFGTVINPDGTKADSNHRLYATISYDFLTVDGKPYPNVETTDGTGKIISFKNGEGIISWMSEIHSSFSADDSQNTTELGSLQLIIIRFRNIIMKMANVIQKLLGFV